VVGRKEVVACKVEIDQTKQNAGYKLRGRSELKANRNHKRKFEASDR
jgi:hypothetical protein